MGDQRRLGYAAALMTNYFYVRGDYDRALASGQRARAIATAVGELALQVRERTSTSARCTTPWATIGRPSTSCRWNVAALTGELLQEHLGLPGLASVLSRTWLVRCLVELGTFAEGRVLGDEGDPDGRDGR